MIAETFSNDFASLPCGDCGQIGGTFCCHRGLFLPDGVSRYFCRPCFDRRKRDFRSPTQVLEVPAVAV